MNRASAVDGYAGGAVELGGGASSVHPAINAWSAREGGDDSARSDLPDRVIILIGNIHIISSGFCRQTWVRIAEYISGTAKNGGRDSVFHRIVDSWLTLSDEGVGACAWNRP